MSPARRPARPPRRPAARRQPSSASSALLASLDLDERRYLAHLSGVSAAEIAARENVRVSTIEQSLERKKLERARFSQASLEHTVRQSVIESFPTMQAAIVRALTATYEKIRHLGVDEETGVELTEVYEVQDHKTQLAAVTKLKELIDSITADSPLVNINQNTLNQQNLQLLPGQVSVESLIREVRLEKGLTQAMETQPLLEADVAEELLPDRRDFELERELAALAATEGIIDAVVEEEGPDEAPCEDAEEDILPRVIPSPHAPPEKTPSPQRRD